MNLISTDLVSLIGKEIKGLTAQVRNRKYIDHETQELWRTIKSLRTHTENGKDWVTLYWEPRQDGMGYDCGFTGCTVEHNACRIEFTKSEYCKIK